MKRVIYAILFLSVCFIFYSCGQKKVETKEIYINPVFKESLDEAIEIISKRYTIDYSELKKKFGNPVKLEIDSVLSEINDKVFDSTYTAYYPKVTLHFYKRSYDKRFFCTKVELQGEFKAKQYTLTLNEPKDEVLLLFGDPSFTKMDDKNEELTYASYKDDAGTLFDSIILIFKEEKFIGLRYEPYQEIYPESNNNDQSNNY